MGNGHPKMPKGELYIVPDLKDCYWKIGFSAEKKMESGIKTDFKQTLTKLLKYTFILMLI